MASLSVLAPFILSWEGGYCNVPGDKGGATNRGVTLATWRLYGYDKDHDGDIDANDVRLITVEDAVERVMRPHYWNRCKGDQIECQQIANILVDWAWNSGVTTAVKQVQRVLGVKADGIVGPTTLGAINHHRSPGLLFEAIWKARKAYYEGIVARNPSQKKFLAGWMRRLNSITWFQLKLNK